LYLLYLDESGTHAASPVFILSGIAVHENDVFYVQRALNRQVAAALRPLRLDPADFEIHANELRAEDAELQARPAAKGRKARKASHWAQVPKTVRRKLLNDCFRSLANFKGCDPTNPPRLFGAIVRASYMNKEERAYELVLNKFDEMLGRLYHEGGPRQRGLVIHDVRQKEEPGIQYWTTLWRERAGNVGKINNIVDVPMFLDSRATRVIQAADLVSYALWRYYGPASEERYLKNLWNRFDNADAQMHGVIHVTPAFARAECYCPPCHNRLVASGAH
jgi:hypothetical protein